MQYTEICLILQALGEKFGVRIDRVSDIHCPIRQVNGLHKFYCIYTGDFFSGILYTDVLPTYNFESFGKGLCT